MRKVFRTIALIVAFFIMLTVFTACASKHSVPNADAIIFTDALGRDVLLEKRPERVAALIGSFADIWILSGGSLCAAAEDAWDDFGLDLPDTINLLKDMRDERMKRRIEAEEELEEVVVGD